MSRSKGNGEICRKSPLLPGGYRKEIMVLVIHLRQLTNSLNAQPKLFTSEEQTKNILKYYIILLI